jgi:hypothetical protein
MSRKAKVLLIDIETTPNLAWCWGHYEQDVLRYQQEWELLCFAYKELGSSRVDCISRRDFKDTTDRALTEAIWKIVDEADVLIGHNIDAFDSPKLKAKFAEHGLAPPRPYKTIDTKKIAKFTFKFNSNSLNNLGYTLKLGAKLQTGGIDLWFACMEGDPAAWRKMIAYNKQDVLLLERVYERLKAWYGAHPNLSLYEDRPGCPVCKSQEVQRRGFNVARVRKSPRFQCQACSHWFTGPK